jgi:peroxiredoxin family protein
VKINWVLNSNLKGEQIMPVTTLDIKFNEEGFLVNANEWTEDLAKYLAEKEGLMALTDRPWQVIRFMRKEKMVMYENGKNGKIEKVAIIISRGSLEGVYPGLIMANGARMEGIDATIFFTFFGLEAIIKKRMKKLKVATVGNPGMHIPSLVGILPGMSAFATKMMQKEMDKLDIPPVDEFIEMVHDAGAKLYACKASVDMFHLTKADFCEQVEDIINVGTFYEKSAGAQIIFP